MSVPPPTFSVVIPTYARPDALRTCLLLAQKLGQNAASLVRSEHTWKRVAEKTEAVYERILRKVRFLKHD